MTQERFEITVEVLNRAEEKTAIATASAYLAHADLTDTIGYNPNFTNVTVGYRGRNPVSVTFSVALTLVGEKELERFMEELEQLSKVTEIDRHIPQV